MDTVRRIFKKTAEHAGVLCIQGNEHKDASLSINSNNLAVSGLQTPLLIPMSAITDLELKEDSLGFVFSREKFKFTGKGAKMLFEGMRLIVAEKSIFKAPIDYFTYDIEKRTFKMHEKPAVVRIMLEERYYLRVEDEDSIVHLEEITTGTQYYMDQDNNSFVWSVFSENAFHTFCAKFRDRIDFLEFLTRYVESSYKSVNSEQSQHKFFEDMVKIQETCQNPPDSPAMPGNQDDYQDDWTEHEEPQEKGEFSKDEHMNEHLVVGNGQVFVARGSSLGVFGVTQDDLPFRTHIQNVLNDPHKIITHGRDQSLLVLDNDQRDKLQLLDLSRGEVVEKWEIRDKMNDYFDSAKLMNDGTLVGVSDYSLFRIDPRMKDKVAERKEYKTRNEFSCGVATGSGDVAVASRKGDLRLYNRINVRAKSLLPGFGDEIVGIDTSRDGSLILCTCENYILMFKANADYSKTIGKSKSTPRRLQLKPQHLSLIKERVSFIPAKFDQDDSLIISGTGRYVVKWKVSDVVSGDVYNYSLKALYDTVVDENFIFNGADIVVALPNDVRKVSEKELRRPK